MMANALDALRETFPWLNELGLEGQLASWVADPANTVDSVLALVRQSEPYRQRYPWIRRSDGTMRMNEATYRARQDDYSQVAARYGYTLNDPQAFGAWFQGGVSVDEVAERFRIYDAVQRGGSELRGAFYVYAGMRLGDDDLYKMVVDPTSRSERFAEYNRRVASGDLDYQTWVSRVTEVALEQAITTVEQLIDRGVASPTALAQLRDMDPTRAQQLVDVLYHGGDLTGGTFLQLNELVQSFEYAVLGSAALQVGLELPDKDRLEALRQAGVDRAKALSTWSSWAQNESLLEGMLSRAGADEWSVEDFERATLLADPTRARQLQKAVAQEVALGAQSGAAQVRQGPRGPVQPGLRRA